MSTNDRFNIPCPQCGVLVAVAYAHIGKKGRCPECKTVFPITAQAAAAAQPTPAPGLQPLTPGLQPMTPGLQPMPPGLQPMQPGLQPMPPGLQPMAPGLQPMTPGLQPIQPGQQQWPGNPQPQPQWQPAQLPNPYGQAPPSPYGQPAPSPFAPPSPYGQPAPGPYGPPSPFGQPAYGPPSPFGQAGYGQPAYGQPQHPTPFDDPSFGRPKPADDELRLAPDANPNPYAAPQPTLEETMRRANEKESWRKTKEKDDINGALWGGMGLMAFGVVLFFTGLFFGFFTCWAPIAFIAGLCTFAGGVSRAFNKN